MEIITIQEKSVVNHELYYVVRLLYWTLCIIFYTKRHSDSESGSSTVLD
jgi:hypothetical protein